MCNSRRKFCKEYETNEKDYRTGSGPDDHHVHDRKIAADLSQVFVQMKISVIHSADDMDEIVPRISTFANTLS